MIDDRQLLRRYVDEGAQDAFAELVQRYIDLVYSAALRQVAGDAHHAEDVVQLVFDTLARKAGRLSEHPVLIGWLYTTTQHAAAKLRRTEARRRVREKAFMNDEIAGSSAEEADWDRLRPVLDELLRELNERDREAILLRYFARRSYGDIGTTLELSEDAARMRVDRALEKLRGLFGRRGVTSTAAALGTLLVNQAVTAAPSGLAATVATSALTASSAASISFLSLMSATKISVAIAGTAIVIAAGAAFFSHQTKREADAALVAATRESAAMRSQTTALQSRVDTAERDIATLEQAIAAAAADATAEAEKSAARERAGGERRPAVAASWDPITQGRDFLARHAEVRQALMDRSRARVDARYRPLYRALNLSPEQIAQFQQLLIEGEGVTMESTDGPLLLRPGSGMSRKEVDAGVRTLLGDDGYKQYQDVTMSVGPRQFALRLAGALYFTDTPLTAQQATQLTEIGTSTMLALRKTRATPEALWDAVMPQLQSVLAPPQVAALEALRDQDAAQSAVARVLKGPPMPGWGGK